MRDLFSLRTVRKKLLMLTKLAGAALVLSYPLSSRLPAGGDAVWFLFVVLLVLALDWFMGRFISLPISRLNASAKRMADLDFSARCEVSGPDGFGELAASFNKLSENLRQALDRLEAALEGRKELADSLSHEVKTPLGIIRAYAEGLQDETDEARRQRYAQVIAAEAERMNDLVVTLLDLSALESGAARLNVTRFDFVELVETAAGRLLVDAPDGDFDLQYGLPEGAVSVEADRRRIEQVLENLIVNAKKSVRPGGVLRLELRAEGETLRFSVFNQGRHIPKDALAKIWTKFYRDRVSTAKATQLNRCVWLWAPASFRRSMATLTKRPHFRSRRTRTCSTSVGIPAMMTKSRPLTHH